MRQINLTNTQQHYNMCQKKVLIGYATHQFNKYTAKLQSVPHKSMYLETDQLSCFARHSRKSSSLARSLNTFFCCRTLSVIETCDELLGNHLVSIEWLLIVGNPGDNLSDVVETITKEGLVPLHLCSRCISH